MKYTQMQAYKLALAGVDFLTERGGSDAWLQRINFQKIDILRGDVCILGQLHGTYTKALEGYGIDDEEAIALGFWADLNTDDYGNNCRKLDNAWREIITERLARSHSHRHL